MDSYMVPNPMARPDYVFYHTPTTDELRQRAVQAMLDFLTIQWRTYKKIPHSKVGAVAHKRFIYEAEVIHAGLPYTDAGMGLFQFYEFYDAETGRLKFYGDGQDFNANIGGTCACGVCWSLATVCHSIGGKYINFWMNPKYNYLPVGDYKIDPTIEEYRHYHTSKIIEENGIDLIVDAYTKIQPADAVTSSPKDHTMMCIDYPHVEYNEDGSINLDKSYVYIADQRGGTGDGFYVERLEDDLLYLKGRTKFKYTFAMFLKESYIPVTTKEFMGLEPYKRAEVRFSEENCTTKEQLAAGSVTCNYPMAVVKLMLIKGNGERVMIDRYMFNRNDPHSGLARNYPLSNMADAINAAAGHALEVEVVASNGEIIIPVRVNL